MEGSNDRWHILGWPAGKIFRETFLLGGFNHLEKEIVNKKCLKPQPALFSGNRLKKTKQD